MPFILALSFILSGCATTNCKDWFLKANPDCKCVDDEIVCKSPFEGE